jgi:hypothetical protein
MRLGFDGIGRSKKVVEMPTSTSLRTYAGLALNLTIVANGSLDERLRIT